jgi:hypothetical protein
VPRADARLRPLLAVALLLLAPHTTAAHFVLRSPPSWRVQNGLGDPQKRGPCGDEGNAPTTGTVTAFSPGETITIVIDETIFHPGHYRVALAVNDRSELPAEPEVAPGETPCGSVAIETSPAFPVLVDGALQHTEPFPDARFIQVTLPSDVTCARCTLQVLEFMSDHAAPCFYHHCADISIGVGGAACRDDADCTDDDVCTSDRCNRTTNACEHVDTVTPTCDDGDPCTQDACSSTRGCVTQPITLADVAPKLLAIATVPPCATDEIPPAIAKLLDEAETFLARAAHTPTQAERLLRRAAKRLRAAGKQIARMRGRKLTRECAVALGAVVDEARGRVACLRS